MSGQTPATKALTQRGTAFDLVRYDYDRDAEKVGLQAAESLGAPASRVLKTLIIAVDGKPVCVILPSDKEVSMKRAAAAFGGKSARMMPVPDAERITGYKVGGVSPFGQRKALPTAIEESAMAEDYVFVNGGQRGTQLRLDPADVVAATGAVVTPLAI